MKRLACAFFGHRDCPDEMLTALYAAIETLYLEKGVNIFWVGYQGNFDTLARKALRSLKKVYPELNWNIVLSYMPTPDRLPLLHKDESTYFPEGIEMVPPRYAIAKRNEWMVKNCDYVICYVEHNIGGAAKYVEMAEKRGKTIINLAKQNRPAE